MTTGHVNQHLNSDPESKQASYQNFCDRQNAVSAFAELLASIEDEQISVNLTDGRKLAISDLLQLNRNLISAAESSLFELMKNKIQRVEDDATVNYGKLYATLEDTDKEKVDSLIHNLIQAPGKKSGN